MQFFAWGISKPGVGEQRTALIKTHWAFIDRFDDKLIARGPTLETDDAGVVTGSIHIADLEDRREAERFVYEEPFAAAGLFETITLARFELGLNRTQFEFVSTPDRPRFFVYCPAQEGHAEKSRDMADAHNIHCLAYDAFFVCRGSLLADDGAWQGSVYFLEMDSEQSVKDFLAGDPYAVAGLYDKTEIRRWTMGGPANLNAAGTAD